MSFSKLAGTLLVRLGQKISMLNFFISLAQADRDFFGTGIPILRHTKFQCQHDQMQNACGKQRTAKHWIFPPSSDQRHEYHRFFTFA